MREVFGRQASCKTVKIKLADSHFQCNGTIFLFYYMKVIEKGFGRPRRKNYVKLKRISRPRRKNYVKLKRISMHCLMNLHTLFKREKTVYDNCQLFFLFDGFNRTKPRRTLRQMRR